MAEITLKTDENKKNCSRCKKQYDIEYFINHKNINCKICNKCREQKKKYYEKNKGKIKKYYENNKKKLLTANRLYRENNKEKISEQNQKRKQDRIEQIERDYLNQNF